MVAVQSLSLAHAAANGEAPHDHDGISCELSAVVSEQTAILPSAPVVPVALARTTDYATPLPRRLDWAQPPGRAPPPRGPPNRQSVGLEIALSGRPTD
ncbi:MAG: hypothetical protein GYB42_10655 [Alphaproteobacteria bacterium]|nr:hypothetical protein [Alphaproteobacteria bacterium]